MRAFNLPRLTMSRVVSIGVIIGLLFMAIWIYQSSAIFVEKAQKAKDENIRLSAAAQQMRVDVIQVQQWLTDISATRALDGLDDGFTEAESSYLSLISGLDVFEAFYDSRDQVVLAQVRGLRNKAESYYESGKTMADAYIIDGPAAGNKKMADFDDAASALYNDLNPFVDEQISALSLAMEEIVDSASTLKNVTVLVFSIVFLVTFSGLFIQNRNNLRQIEKIMVTMREAADGDLTTNMREESGQLAGVSSAVNDLLSQFSEIISRVKENANFVYLSAEEISEGNDDLSRRLQEQASSLEETASSMEEMTSTIKHNTNAANEANKLVNTTRNDAEKGRRVVQQAIVAMADINNSSSKIADIIDTIDSIAFQTNLLALNAAVEAARAGDQGRGFAVVASEVRVLAQRSAQAAKEIKELIDESVEKVRIGAEQVDESGVTLLSIVDGIKKVSDLVSEINSASQQQAMGIDEVNTAVAHIDGRIQENAAFVEQSSASTKRMKDQAEVLNKVISYFKLGGHIEADASQQLVPLQLDQSS